MIQGEHRVIAAVQRLREHRVRGNRAVHLPSLPAGVLDRRGDLFQIFLA